MSQVFLTGKVEAALVNCDYGSVVARNVGTIKVVPGEGVKGDTHEGTRRFVDARERDLLRFGIHKETEMVNLRHFSALSLEEMIEIQHKLCLPERILPGILGENLIISGIRHFTHLPMGTKLFFKKSEQRPRNAVLIVMGENTPCVTAGTSLHTQFPDIEGLATSFPKISTGLRGVVGIVCCSGIIEEGDEVTALLPDQHSIKEYFPETLE